MPKASDQQQYRKAKVTDENREEARLLKALWDVKIHETQEIFGERYEIGGQSAVGQFLRGEVPLSLKAARGFAKGLKCEIADFSPRLSRLASDIGLVAGAPETDLTRLQRDELQLVQLFRGISVEQRDELLQAANNLYSAKHPGPSKANPFGKAPPKE